MSKAVKLDGKVNKNKLQELTKEAIGNGRINNFASKSGVSITVLSRLLNDKQRGTTLPATLEKIAKASEGRISSEEILEAGGYDPIKYMSMNTKREQRLTYYGGLRTLEDVDWKIREVGKIWKVIDDIKISYTGGNYMVTMLAKELRE